MEVSETTNALVNGRFENIITLGVFTLLVLGIVILLAKSGIFRFKGSKLSVGIDDSAREILRRQLEFLINIGQDLTVFMPDAADGRKNTYMSKYAAELVIDEMITWCCVNHITDDDFYIKNKQIIVWNILQTLDWNPNYDMEKFKKDSDEEVKKVVSHLLKIKDYYKNK